MKNNVKEIKKNYIKKWKELIDIERTYEIEHHKEEIRRLGKKREKYGRAILNLNGKIIGEEFGKTVVRYSKGEDLGELDIGVGDVVLISKGDPLKSDLLGDVIRMGNKFIDVSFEKIPPRWALKNVRIDLYTNDITFKRMKEALKQILKKDNKIIDIILGIKKPNKIKKLEDLKFFDKSLNEVQKQAVKLAVSSEDLFLVHGPPGTGKTRTLTEIILQEAEKGKKILVCADSNIAVDNILMNLAKYNLDNIVRIGHPSRINSELIEYSLHYKIILSNKYPQLEMFKYHIKSLMEEREKYLKPIPQYRRGLTNAQIKKYALKKKNIRGIPNKIIKSMAKWIEISEKIKEMYEKLKNIETDIIKDILKKHNIVLATNSMAGSEFLKDMDFDVCIIDEGSQSMEPSCLIPIVKSKKLIMAGDHKQLPPTVLSNLEELKKTLFERLIEKYPDFSIMLRVQYRMNEKIMKFPSEMFYNGLLIAHESVKNQTILDLVKKIDPNDKEIINEKPIIFINCKGEERRDRESLSYYNIEEAEIVKKYAKVFLKYKIPFSIITPYDAQVKYLKRILGEEIEINSVDGFQGRENEVIIVSFVRTKDLGFLRDLRRLNVAITRAKRKLILVGNEKNLKKHEVYRKLIEYCRSI